MGLEPQRCGQHGELLGDEGAQCSERGLGVEPCTHRPHLGDAPGELLGDTQGREVAKRRTCRESQQTHYLLGKAKERQTVR